MELTIEYTHIDSFVPNAWNPNVQSDFIRERTRRSIVKFDFVDPITVRETNSDGTFEILDGQHRWEEAKKLELTEIPYINLGKISDATAKQLTIVLNETKGKFDTIELSNLLNDLKTELSYEELLNDLPYEPEELDSLLELKDFDWTQFENASNETINSKIIFSISVSDETEAQKIATDLEVMVEKYSTAKITKR